MMAPYVDAVLIVEFRSGAVCVGVWWSSLLRGKSARSQGQSSQGNVQNTVLDVRRCVVNHYIKYHMSIHKISHMHSDSLIMCYQCC